MNFGLHGKQSRFAIGFIFLFFLISPITAWAGVDVNDCIGLYKVYYENSSCNLNVPPPNINGAIFQDKCEQSTGVFEQNINKFVAYGSSLDENKCKEIYSFFKNFELQNSTPTNDIESCVKELTNCTQLFLSCKGNLGSIDTTDLEGQCNGFLQGGKKWKDLKGAGFCQQALKLDAPIKDICDSYKEKIGAGKYKLDFDPDKEAAAITAQKQKLEAETDTVFNQINTTNASTLIGRMINTAMGILGSLALAMFVYGGFLWMTAAGESAKSEKARSVVVWAALGIAVIFASYAILQMVFEAFV